MILSLAAKQIGIKELAHKLRWSESMLKKVLAGEKPNFLGRTEEFLDLLSADRRLKGLGLALVDSFAKRVGGTVVTAKQAVTIQQIASRVGVRVEFSTWEDE